MTGAPEKPKFAIDIEKLAVFLIGAGIVGAVGMASQQLNGVTSGMSRMESRMATLEERVLLGMSDRYTATQAASDNRLIDNQIGTLDRRLTTLEQGREN